MSEENMSPAASAGDQREEEGEGMGGSSSSSKTKTIVIVVIVLAVLGALYAITKTDTSVPEAAAPADQAVTPTENTAAAVPPAGEVAPASGATVTFTDAGYAPDTVTVKKGDTVTFENKGTIATWPASATHPTHTVYPGSGIEKCGTGEQAGIFDACRGLNALESWSFQFNEVGTWKYHDHLNAGKFGTIIVTE